MRPVLQSGHGVAAARQGIGRATRTDLSDASQVVAGWKKGRSEFLILAMSPFLLPDQQGDRRPPVHRQQPWRCKDRVWGGATGFSKGLRIGCPGGGDALPGTSNRFLKQAFVQRRLSRRRNLSL